MCQMVYCCNPLWIAIGHMYRYLLWRRRLRPQSVVFHISEQFRARVLEFRVSGQGLLSYLFIFIEGLVLGIIEGFLRVWVAVVYPRWTIQS